MRKIVAGLAITLDGVVEAPSTSSWMLFNDEMAAVIDAGIAQADAILLGRRTYLEFAEPRLPHMVIGRPAVGSKPVLSLGCGRVRRCDPVRGFEPSSVRPAWTRRWGRCR